jgi:hypothetical protein
MASPPKDVNDLFCMEARSKGDTGTIESETVACRRVEHLSKQATWPWLETGVEIRWDRNHLRRWRLSSRVV